MDRYYTTLYKDIPHGTEIMTQSFFVVSIAWDDCLRPEQEIHVIDGAYIYKE